MRLLADEGIDRQIVERLRKDGHDVLYVAELDPGVTDSAVLSRAAESNLLLITADKDFGELVFRQHRANSGVVLLRIAGLGAEAKVEATSAALNQHGHEMSGAFTVLAPGSIRIRKGSAVWTIDER